MSLGRVFFIVLGLMFFPYLLFAGSIRLVNNSPYDLRAVIQGGDGSFLGEVIIKSQKETDWTDTYGNYGTYGGANAKENQSSYSKTPYTVLWYCLSGTDYAVCDTVSTGAMVTAQSCLGTRMCKGRKVQEKKSPLRDQHYEAPEPPPLDQ